MDRALGLRLGTALLVAGALVSCGSGSSTPKADLRTGSVPTPTSVGPSASAPPSADTRFFDGFDNNDNDWPTRTAPDGTTIAVTGGGYQVTLPARNTHYIRPAALAARDDLRSGVSVTGTVRAVSGKTYAVGLACRLSPSERQYYAGRLLQDGTSELVRREKGAGERILDDSHANPIHLPPIHLTQGRPVRLVLFCGEKEGTMDLRLTVNGDVAVQAEDPRPLPENPAGIYAVAGAESPTSTFTFDDVVVEPFTPE
jgi:hypothetical protein